MQVNAIEAYRKLTFRGNERQTPLYKGSPVAQSILEYGCALDSTNLTSLEKTASDKLLMVLYKYNLMRQLCFKNGKLPEVGIDEFYAKLNANAQSARARAKIFSDANFRQLVALKHKKLPDKIQQNFWETIHRNNIRLQGYIFAVEGCKIGNLRAAASKDGKISLEVIKSLALTIIDSTLRTLGDNVKLNKPIEKQSWLKSLFSKLR